MEASNLDYITVSEKSVGCHTEYRQGHHKPGDTKGLVLRWTTPSAQEGRKNIAACVSSRDGPRTFYRTHAQTTL